MKILYFIFYLLESSKKNKWEWSWNGSSPHYIIDILFLKPLKEYIKHLNHIKKYSLVTSDHGKKITGYIINKKDYEEKCNLFFKKNIESYIISYKKLIKKTNNVLSLYKRDFRENKSINIKPNELRLLAKLLIENIKLYLISQPEATSILEKVLSNEIKEYDKIKDKISKLLQPKETIINMKDLEFDKLLEKIKNKEEENKKEIFDFYWKYRSFFMIDLNAEIKEELNLLMNSIKEQKNCVENEERNEEVNLLMNSIKEQKNCVENEERNEEVNYELSKRCKKIIKDIQEMGAIRLEGKNTWMNLTLLITNLLQQVSKQINVPIKFLEKYSFDEVISLLENKKIKNKTEKRKNAVFIITPSRINTYYGKYALNMKKIIEKNSKNTDSNVENVDFIKGNVAYNGNVIGTVFTIDYQDNLSDKIKEISNFKNPILVTEQTIPSYIPLIKKSKAVITNEGGILSHAAIVAREFKIPTLIGTKFATKIFKTGDEIILDTKKAMAFKRDFKF
jgi:pyruvate,water dikinase